MKSNFFTHPLTRGIIATFALVLCAPEYSAATTIDEISNLQYWLDHAPNGEESDWQAKDGIKSSVEDGPDPSGYLGPGFGGQHYDAEAIYVELTQDFLNIAVVTGLNPGNRQDPGNNSYAPGDIAIDFGYTPGTPSFELGIVTTGTNAGKVYLVGYTQDGWDYGIWDDGGLHNGNTYSPHEADFKKLEHPTIVKNTSDDAPVSTVPFYYDRARHGTTEYRSDDTGHKLGGLDDGSDDHYLIATSINLAILPEYLLGQINNNEPLLAHWTMRCANDYIQVDPVAGVPEPSPLLLMLGSLFTLAGFSRFRKR